MNRKNGTMKIKNNFGFGVKSINDDGTFSGYGSIFGNEDSYGEIVAPGAFTDSLAEIAAKGRPLPILWQHNPAQPIGYYTTLKQDDIGLYVEGTLLKDDVSQAREAYALMRAGIVSGLSIGYWVRESSLDEKTSIRTLLALDLVECSVVTFPANDEARIEEVKMKLARGELPSLPEFEKVLREVGFSKTQSAAVASRGLKHLLRSESEGVAKHAEAANALASELADFKLPSFS